MERKRKKITPAVFLELAKVKITVAVSITTAGGYLLASGGFTFPVIGVVSGIFLLACGSSVINHIQDRRYDFRMGRTHNRPLPAGKISLIHTWIYALLLTLAGAAVLFLVSGWPALGLGLLAMIWYNGIYTYMKRITAYAVVPGSVIGAIPPVIGWISGGGSPYDPKMIVLAIFFFIWQVPHFWLLMVKYGKDYERAGYPTLTTVMDEKTIFRMIYMWVLATVIITSVLPLTGLIRSMISSVGIWMSAAYLLYIYSRQLFSAAKPFKPGFYFMQINYFVLITVLFMIMDPFLARLS